MIDLTSTITQAQIAFGIMVIAVVVFWRFFVKYQPPTKKKNK